MFCHRAVARLLKIIRAQLSLLLFAIRSASPIMKLISSKTMKLKVSKK